MPDVKRFDCLGMDFNHPVDQMKPGKYTVLNNVRSYQGGRIEARQGLTQIGTGLVVAGQTPCHTVRRLNDDLNASWTRVIGTGTHLAVGQTTFVDTDSGYSGNPLSLIPWRPEQAPDAWMYIGDSVRARKVRRDGTLHQFGVPFPTAAPSAAIAAPTYATIGNEEATIGWTAGGTAGAPTLLSVGPGFRINTTITAILYDAGTTGLASIQPASAIGITEGALVNVNPGGGTAETPVVQQVLPAITTTTIGSIAYDSGTTGLCSIHFATPPLGLAVNSLINIAAGGGAENVRITDVVVSPDGAISVRCSTVNNHVATNAITGLVSFRIFLASNHIAAEVLRYDGLRTSVTVGTGTMSNTTAIDLAVLGSRNVQPEDYVHVAVRFNTLANLVEGKVMFDVDGVTNDFTQNFYYFAFRSSDLAPASGGTLTALSVRQTAIQRAQIDVATAPRRFEGVPAIVSDIGRFQGLPVDMPPTAVAEANITRQTELGNNVWLDIRFRVSDLIRVGTDDSRTLRNIAAIRMSFNVTGTTTCDFGAWWLGGSFGPDVGDIGQPYKYMYRGRVGNAGAKSPFSPPMRSGITPHRQSVTVTLTQHPTTEVDRLDVFRWGGTLLQWTYVGSTANGATPTFTDGLSDDMIAGQPLADIDHYQPWPVIDKPRSGTTVSVAGSTILDSGVNFNTSWAPGTLIRVNGVPFTIYRVNSTANLEIYENAGNLGAVSWEVPEPLLMAQVLPSLWGPFQGFFFACGDAKNPGRLYFSKGNDPDATRGTYWLDVTTPSEPLINGCVYNGRCWVFSSERMFAVYPSFGEFNLIDPVLPGPGLFRAVEVPNGKGLFSRWALAVGPKIWFLGRDGIYETTGGEPTNITNEDMMTFFPLEGNVGQNINTFTAPNISQTNVANLRLSYYDEWLYFEFTISGASGNFSLVYDTIDKAWFIDSYNPNVNYHYGEEGQNVHALLCCGGDGKLYQYTGTADGTSAISATVHTGRDDEGNPRQGKFYSELIIDADTGGANISVSPTFDNDAVILGPFTVNTPARARTLIDFGAGIGQFAYNMGLQITWNALNAQPKLYWWKPKVETAPDAITKWISQPTTHDMQGYQHLRDAYISIIASGAVTLTVTADGAAYTFTIPIGTTGNRKVYVPLNSIKGKYFTYLLTSTSTFRLFRKDCEVRVKQWADPGPFRVVNPFGDPSREGGAPA